MKANIRGGRKNKWKRRRTGPVEVQAVRKLANPAFSSPRLVSRSLDGFSEPAPPSDLQITQLRKCAILIGKDDHVIPEYDEQICHFLPVPLPFLFLVTVNPGIAP